MIEIIDTNSVTSAESLKNILNELKESGFEITQTVANFIILEGGTEAP